MEFCLFNYEVGSNLLSNQMFKVSCIQLRCNNDIKSNFKKTNYTYRFLFIPETIGSINYISDNFKNMKKKIFAGYTISCVGDERAFSLIHSPYQNNTSCIAYCIL